MSLDDQAHVGRLGVFEDIRQTFLNEPVQCDFQLWRKTHVIQTGRMNLDRNKRAG